MIKYIVKRMVTVFVVLWMVATLTYFTVHVTPGDTATAILYSVGGESAVNSENLERVRSKYDLDRPVHEQYFEWVINAFKGELGTSYKYNKPVSYMLKLRVPNTIRLGGRLFTLLISSFPSFWVAIVLIIVCALKLKLLPVGGMQGPQSLILPAVTLSMGMTAATTRMMRSSMLDVMGQDYIWVSRAKGLKWNKIITRHMLKNALPPIITVIGLQIGHILGGAVIIENIFSWPGVGGLLIDAINAKDTPMIEGCVLLIAFGYAMVNLIVDIIYACLDPKLKYGGEDA